MFFVFFFSSRRRHTRCSRDWSSDVCSSDLGAMLAACAMWIQGEPPLLLDMRAVRDFDHVVALFRRRGLWGAISKTNGIGLRWRDPVYRSLRELAMSYFHEYYNRLDHKTLREYSVPFDLRRVDPKL